MKKYYNWVEEQFEKGEGALYENARNQSLKQLTEYINEYLTEDSKFLQITRGNNSFGYEAESGVENIIITIEYKRKYEGA